MITNLRLQHFRSYGDKTFHFRSGVTIIAGPNASGKTNLLEAILVLATGSSYRVKDVDLIERNQSWARLDAHNQAGELRTVKLLTEPSPSKSYELAGKPTKRLLLKDTLPVVLFEPNHLQLLTGSPSRRRDYLDELLSQTQPGYATHLRNYKRTLAQRNSLLKQPLRAVEGQMFAWDVRLSELAATIVRARASLVDGLQANIGELYKDVSHAGTEVSLRYESRFRPEHYESHMLKKLENDLQLDKMRGFTATGPHREDLAVLFEDRLASETASRGEARTAVLALKILELRMLHAVRGEAPLLLLDDVFSELDSERRKALTSYLKEYQTFITTTDADVAAKHFAKDAHIIKLA
ncbi:MAG: replication and repair protein RecF [Candidatus Saccharibacteria bacterium]|nr:replication and repair protein RecF [Candidatus Saccharibacteria bacterium]